MTSTAIRLALLAALVAGAMAAAVPAAPRHLLVQVRDTPPRGPAGIRHGADGSYSVSTGGGDSDERGAQGPDNATILSTSNRIRRVHIVEGERVRVDLPAVQSLQFHLGQPGGSAAGKSSAAGPAGTASAASGARGGPAAGGAANAGTGSAAGAGAGTTSAAPAISGVVYFDAVTAFAARFAVAGRMVRIELTPLHRGSVAAPHAAGGAGTDAPVTVSGRLGEWIALGDTDLDDTGTSLTPTAEPTTPASVWVRVDPEAVDAAQ